MSNLKYTNTYTRNGNEISFMNVDLFIKTAISYTTLSYNIPMEFTSKLHNLIRLTSLSHLTLVQALFYLKSVQGLHTRKEDYNGLFIKTYLLLMIANKYLDDYSFNLKTWINLTGLTKEFIVSQEISLLKMLNYDLNGMFKDSKYNAFVEELRRFAYVPLTPDSPTIEISSNICSLLNYEQPLHTNPYIRQPIQSVESSFTTPPYSNSLVYPNYYFSYYDQQTLPVSNIQHTDSQFCGQINNNDLPITYSSYNSNISSRTTCTPNKKRSHDMTQSSQYIYETPPAYKSRRLTHQGDCDCCKLTNTANKYCSEQFRSMNFLTGLPLSLVPVVYHV